MSASLLNLASLSGAAAQPGAATGIAQQAAQAAQAQGPLAGFEALLAAFFGDQGTAATTPGAPGAATTAQGPLALLAGQAPAGGKPTDAKAAKAAATDGTKSDAKTGKSDQAAAAGDTAVDAAALALLTPATTAQLPQVQTVDPDPTAGEADPGLGGKAAGQPALAQPAAVANDVVGKAAKAAVLSAAQADPTAQAQSRQTTAAPIDDGKTASGAAKPAVAPTLPQPTLTNQAAAATAQTLPPPPPPAQPVAMPTRTADVATPGATKDKGPEVKTAGRVQGAPISPPAPSGGATKTEIAQATAAAADASGKDADAETHDPAASSADAKAAPASDAGQPATSFTTALNAQAANNPAALAHATTLVRGSPQTVANLAAQIAKKLDGRSTRFDVQLDPAGLGKVDVRVEIDAAGKMSAALNFDNQQAASELKSRAGELQRAMEQAGFDLSGGLSFDVSGQGGQAQGQDGDSSPGFRGRAFQAVLEGGADSAVNPQTAYRQASASGVDIRI
jgi:hypothetical protein